MNKGKLVFFVFFIVIMFIILIAADGCQTTEEVKKEEEKTEDQTDATTQKVEQKKNEKTTLEDQEAEKKLQETKNAIIKAEQLGANEYAPDALREAQALYAEAEKVLYETKDYKKFQEIIEKARQKADLAYLETAKLRYEDEKKKIQQIKDELGDVINKSYYEDNAAQALDYENKADDLKKNEDHIESLTALAEAKKMYENILNDYNSDKDYVYSEYPKLLDLRSEMDRKNMNFFYPADYRDFSNTMVKIEQEMKNQEYKAVKEYMKSAYVIGRNALDKLNQKLVLVQLTEANRFYFETSERLSALKTKESTFNDAQKTELNALFDMLATAKVKLENQNFEETKSICKEILTRTMSFYGVQTITSGTTYTVRLIEERRDCLWRIAEYSFVYGNPYLWPLIWVNNLDIISNPDLIYPGQVLQIPGINQ